MAWLRAAVWVLLVGLPSGAHADVGAFHQDLVASADQLGNSQGPASYTAIRRVWSTWNRANPAHVEDALLAAEQSPKLSRPARAYAGILSAYARFRRGDVLAARRKLRALGLVTQWAVVGPFDNEGKSGLGRPFGPELEFEQPIVGGKAFEGKERPVRWRQAPATFAHGWVSTASLLRPQTNVCSYFTTYVQAPGVDQARRITVWVGATGAFKLFWNGRERLTDAAYRRHDFDRSAVTVRLQPGVNNLTIKACAEEEASAFTVRLAGADGAPDPGLLVSSDLGLSAQAAEQTKAAQPLPVADAGARGPKGPLQGFEQLVTQRAPSAGVLYDFAEYLVMSRGDDPATHQARDLARRAAEQAPTVPRLLLAGRLAEDRNRRAEWLHRAARLGEPNGQHRADVLLALAKHDATGPNPRRGIDHIDELLRLEPDNVFAIQSRVVFENHAGLPRTALARLERALERSPSSVTLLRLYAEQLNTLGRTAESAVARDRYFALRFDDRAHVNEQLELALDRRNRSAAERWAARLLDVAPDSPWGLKQVARAYRRLGQPDRALVTLERSMELVPEDVGVLRALADLRGELGQRDRQLALLRQLLKIRPQDKEVRQYVEQLEAPAKRPDEAYAWKKERFLKLRFAPDDGHNRRVLRDLTVSTVFENGLSSQFRQVVFQPLTDAAAAEGRQYRFMYEADRQEVQLRGARVYRADGRVDEAIESGEAAANDPSISMYTSARAFYVQFPRLEPRDVVELLYRIDDVTPRNEFADYFGEITHLQSSEPVANAEYVLIVPQSRTLHIDEQMPGLKRSVKQTKSQRIYRFWANDIEPVRPEPAMPPWSEVLGYVHVSTYESWKDLGRWYWGLSKEQFDLDDETRRLARKIAEGKSTTLDKVRAVYGWVVNNTRYVALEFGIYGYKPRRCVQTVARGWGDCKDKATVIVTLLKELGIDATIVILRTQMRGDFRSKLPSLAPFDHAIVYVPELELFLDGTAEHTGSTELPVMDQEALALLVNQGDAELVRVPAADPARNRVERRVQANVAGEGSAKLALSFAVTGSSAASWRRRYHAEATQRERVVADLAGEYPGFEITPGAKGVSATDLNDIEAPVRLQVAGTAPGFARREGEYLSMAVTTPVRLTTRFASLSKRTQDVRLLGVPASEQTIVVSLPPGAKPISGPPDTEVNTPFGSFSVRSDSAPGKVIVHSKLELRVTRVRPDQYAAWRKFCTRVDQAFAPRLVVKP